jgi:hypothetical protein
MELNCLNKSKFDIQHFLLSQKLEVPNKQLKTLR